jgi:hypothetical protein
MGNTPMNLQTRISRADGYRQLEMFADAYLPQPQH